MVLMLMHYLVVAGTKRFNPLQITFINKQEEVAILLISNEADIKAPDENGKILIYYVTKNAGLNLTKFLLVNKANVKDSPEVFFKAVETKGIEIVEAPLRYWSSLRLQNLSIEGQNYSWSMPSERSTCVTNL